MNDADQGFAIINTQPKECPEIHAECEGFAKATPSHKRSIFECEICGECFDSNDYSA